MPNAYKIPAAFLALLLGLLFQQCTHDLPAPATPARIVGLEALATPAQQQLAQEKLLQSPFASKVASGETVAKLAKIRATTSTTSAGKGHAAPGLRQQSICYNWYLVYYTDGVETRREFLYQDCTVIGPDDGDGGGGGGGGGGGDDDNSTLTPNTILVNSPDIPVSDIKQYLRCFNTNAPATLTVYARQPVPGQTDAYIFHGVGAPDVGHTFISITQNGITRVVGFYPTSPISILVTTTGMFGDNSQTSYTASASTRISGGNLYSLLQYIYSVDGKDYNLQTYNCTDFAIRAAHAAGIDLPDTWGRWGGIGGGSNPGNLGNDLINKSLPAGTEKGGAGTSPSNNGTC